MSYTKGPWKVGKWIDDQEVMIDAPNGDKDLATSKWSGLAVVYGSDDFSGGHEKAMANANLIAAAPELLEALKRLVELESWDEEGLRSGQATAKEWRDAFEDADKAIAKAEGRS